MASNQLSTYQVEIYSVSNPTFTSQKKYQQGLSGFKLKQLPGHKFGISQCLFQISRNHYMEMDEWDPGVIYVNAGFVSSMPVSLMSLTMLISRSDRLFNSQIRQDSLILFSLSTSHARPPLPVVVSSWAQPFSLFKVLSVQTFSTLPRAIRFVMRKCAQEDLQRFRITKIFKIHFKDFCIPVFKNFTLTSILRERDTSINQHVSGEGWNITKMVLHNGKSQHTLNMRRNLSCRTRQANQRRELSRLSEHTYV